MIVCENPTLFLVSGGIPKNPVYVPALTVGKFLFISSILSINSCPVRIPSQ
jgi:hypothetical protein